MPNDGGNGGRLARWRAATACDHAFSTAVSSEKDGSVGAARARVERRGGGGGSGATRCAAGGGGGSSGGGGGGGGGSYWEC